jgi:hypothetical protein
MSTDNLTSPSEGYAESEGKPYAAQVFEAYQMLAAERQNPDVPVHDLYRRVGGSLAEFQAFLQQEALGQRLVPSTGEPAFATEEALRTSLTLPGETDPVSGCPITFLNVKLLEPPPAQQKSAQPLADGFRRAALRPLGLCEPYPGTVLLTAEEAELAIKAVRVTRKLFEDGRIKDAADAQEPLHERLARVEEKLGRPVELIPDAARYEHELRERAAARYPDPDPELARKIENKIRRLVNERAEKSLARRAHAAALKGWSFEDFQAREKERELRAAAALQYPHPTLEETRKIEARIRSLVGEFRTGMVREAGDSLREAMGLPPREETASPER